MINAYLCAGVGLLNIIVKDRRIDFFKDSFNPIKYRNDSYIGLICLQKELIDYVVLFNEFDGKQLKVL